MCAFVYAVYILYKRKYWREYSQLKYSGKLDINNLYLIHKSNCTEEIILRWRDTGKGYVIKLNELQ